MSITTSNHLYVDGLRYYKQYTNGNLVASSTNGSMIHFESTKTYEDNIKDYRGKIARIEDATTEGDGIQISGKSDVLTLTIDYVNFGFQIHRVLSGHLNPPGVFANPSYSNTLYDAALTSFVSRARQVQHKFQLGVALGEFRDTIQLIKRPTLIFRRLTSGHKKRVQKRISMTKRRNIKKALAQEWLTYSFGIKPLLNDIDDAMSDLAELTNGRPPSERITVQKRNEFKFGGQSSDFNSLNDWKYNYRASNFARESVTIRGSVKVLVPSLAWAPRKAAILALSDFVPTVWELIPYSFLVDYFINIGDLINCLTFLSSTVQWCNATRRIDTELSSSAKFFVDPSFLAAHPECRFEVGTSYATSRRIDWRRRRVSSFVPGLHFTLPGIGSLKWLNITALLNANRRLS
jgi:hypothetical protein